MDDRTISHTEIYQFAEFTLHVTRRELLRDGVPVKLGARALDTLIYLVRHHGRMATKTEIMAAIWPGTIVEENNLTTQIAAVRRALGDTEGKSFIQTVAGRGYSFVADVREPASGAAPPPTAPPPDPIQERHNLPLETSSFIGRETELNTIAARLRTRALVTLVGAGGVGKTRVALRLAFEELDRFSDGVFLLELAPLTEPRLVAEAACRLFGVPATGDRPAEDMVVSVLRAKNLLLVLDNCEHVLAGAASLASAILRHCPLTKILATSREALGLPGEGVFPMPSLPVPSPSFGVLTAAKAMQCDAVRLFAERAADALGSYTLTDEDAPAVATICRRLDGVPLATELAAARLRMLKPSEIAARLENVFRLLTGGSRVALPRHQTLRATIDWSFSLLSAPEQIMLRRLSVFVDGCSLDGAAAVAGSDAIDEVEVLDLVSALVAKSLVVADTSGSATRYRMLETTRQYAAEKLAEAGETNCRLVMARYLAEMFRTAERTWPTQGTDTWLAAYGPETENLRAAIDWAFTAGDPTIGISLVAHAGAIADEMTLPADLRRWTAAALPHLTPATPKIEAAAVLYLHSSQQKRLGVYEVPAERHQAIALFREVGDDLGLSRALRQTAVARAMPGEPAPDVLSMLDEAVALLRTRAPHKDLATALAHTGGVHFLYGDHAASRRFNEAALAMRETLHDRSGVLASSVNLAEQQFLDGDTPGALRYARQAEAEARARSALPTLALILSNTAGYLLQADDTEAARHAAAEALTLSRAIGQDYLAVMCLEHLALALALSGEAAPAAGLLGFTSAHYVTSGQTREQVEQAGYERLLARLRHDLAPDQLTALMDEGAAWTPAAADVVASAA